MAPHLEWLAEVRSSPYADQLARGFRRLHFGAGLEREYRDYLLRDSFELKRTALAFALAVWLAFAGVDIFMVDGPLLLAMLAIRLVVALLLLALAWNMAHSGLSPRQTTMMLVGMLAMGIGTAAIITLGHSQDPFFPYEGLLLVCIAGYFLAGLRLVEAASASLLVLLIYGLLEWLGGLAPERLYNNLLFLVVGNLIGALGCYVLELKSREYFLVSRLMSVLAHQDSLTGLHNRRSFDRVLARLWRQAQREERTLALLLCDVDHFKAYNDRYGHKAGDQALQQVGAVLLEAARRPLDLAVRLGGEEFAVLLYDIAPEEARQRAEVLRQAVEARAIAHEASLTAPVLTLSVGLCCLQPGNQQTPDSLFEHADRALYEAKAFGRNQVVT